MVVGMYTDLFDVHRHQDRNSQNSFYLSLPTTNCILPAFFLDNLVSDGKIYARGRRAARTKMLCVFAGRYTRAYRLCIKAIAHFTAAGRSLVVLPAGKIRRIRPAISPSPLLGWRAVARPIYITSIERDGDWRLPIAHCPQVIRNRSRAC